MTKPDHIKSIVDEYCKRFRGGTILRPETLKMALTQLSQEVENHTKQEIVEEFNNLVYKLGVAGGVTSSAGVDLREYFHDTLTKATEQARAERDKEIVEWVEKYSLFAQPQKSKDESDERWEIHYAGYREAVKDIINHLIT